MERLPQPTDLVNDGMSGASLTRGEPVGRRGRPPKPLIIDRRCTDSFDAVAEAVASIASRSTWNGTKERVRRWVDRDRTLRPISSKVTGFLLEHINREKGYDWHTAGAIADDLGVHVSAVEKAISELVRGGVILRDVQTVKGRGRATRRWRTTVPALVRASEEVSREHGKEINGPTQQCALDPPNKGVGPTQEIEWTHPENSDGPTQERAIEPIKEPLEEPLPPLPPRSRRLRRDRGERARDHSASGSEVDQLLAPLRSEPAWANPLSLLIEPIARQRRVLAPDPADLLRRVAGWAADLPADTLKAATYRLLEDRHSAVTEENIVAAVRAVQKAAGLQQTRDRPAAPAADADGFVLITEYSHPDEFAGWLAYYEAQARLGRSKRDGVSAHHLVNIAISHRALRVPFLTPPDPAAELLPPVPDNATIH